MLGYLLAFFELVSWIYKLRMGDPGIFFGWASSIRPSISITFVLVSSSASWLKKIDDFSMFIF